MDELTLVAQNSDFVKLKLNSVRRPYVVEEILSVRNKVYSDISYAISIDNDKEIDSISVFVNGEPVNTDYRDNTIYFCGEDRYVFANIIGFVQISLMINYADGSIDWLYSEYASVLIKSTETNKAIDLMLKYVYENQEDILHRETKITGSGNGISDSYDDFWSQIILLEEIANAYENSYGYFMANSRYKLKQVEVLDRVEKLQFVDSKTLQYISQHPEYLKNSVTGIKHGSQCFMPAKTLMMQKQITNDIYENQVIISFLEYVLLEVTKLSEKISEYIELLKTDNESENGYIVSSYLLYLNAKDILLEFVDRILALENQYKKLVSSYSRILNVKRIPMIKRPEPTAIFLNLPQYNRIYLCILKWFGKSGYDLVNERVMLNFINAPSIYEAYVLIKLINQIKDMGYSLIETKNVTYPKQANWMYKNKSYNNVFLFEDDHSKITLFYEPVIYDEDKSNVNEISLYRNNSISLNRETDDERQGRYYVPDFVIKRVENEVEEYYICDAKFSRKNKVRHNLMPDLAYKYITSISPIGEDTIIKGLYVFYGLNEDNTKCESFYDKQINSGKIIKPYINMIPLSENLSYSDQEKNAVSMFME